jgi:putative hydrolase of the HAD superfamily
MRPVRYPFILFDAGETLFGPRESWGAVYARVLRGLGLDRPPEAFDDAIRGVWRALEREVPAGTDRYGHFEGGEDGYWLRFARGAIARAAGRPIDSALPETALPLLRDAFREPSTWRVYPEVRETLSVLRARGARLAVVSNWDSRLPYLLDVLDLDDFFDAVVVSHLVGVEKPDPRIFRIAMELLGADPERTIHVGDVPEIDLEGARAAGIDAVLVDRRGRWDGNGRVVRDLGGILELG